MATMAALAGVGAFTFESCCCVEKLDAVVIGAGVVGLAVARALALAGREVVVLEAEDAIGTHTSSRNSEVIHAGIYYPKGIAEGAQLRRRQGAALRVLRGARRAAPALRQADRRHRRGAGWRSSNGIQTKARANGVDDVRLADARRRRWRWSPSSPASPALLLALDRHHRQPCADARLPGRRRGARRDAGAFRASSSARQVARGRLRARRRRRRAVTSRARPGQQPPASARRAWPARIEGLPRRRIPTSYYAKGNYYSLTGRAPFSRLVYPVPEPGGLGVHVTLDLGGQARFGPDVEWVDRTVDYAVDPRRAERFYAAIRALLARPARRRACAGLCRHPAEDRAGRSEPAPDFEVQGPAVHGVPGLVQPLRHRVARADLEPRPRGPGARGAS